MVRIPAAILIVLLVLSCGAVKKKTSYGKQRKVTVEATEKEAASTSVSEEGTGHTSHTGASAKANDIITTALTYSGVRYKFGGTTKKGMDCSGLLYVAFGMHNIPLPRVSYQMANEGRRIAVNHITKGDLLFFKTSKKGKKINHVGLVVAIDGDEVKFIHSTSSRGVIVSSLREGFWNYAFVKATRVL